MELWHPNITIRPVSLHYPSILDTSNPYKFHNLCMCLCVYVYVYQFDDNKAPEDPQTDNSQTIWSIITITSHLTVTE